MIPNGDAVRRNTVAKKRKTRKDVGNGDATRSKDRRRKRRLQEERYRRVALVFFASLLFFAAILFLCLRPKKGKVYHGVDFDRYARAKALRDAALSGEEGGEGKKKRVERQRQSRPK